MIGSDVVRTLLDRLARFNANATSLTDDQVLRELNLARLRLEMKPCLPWFLLSEKATEQTVPHDERVQVPDTFIRESEDDALYIFDTDGTRYELGKMNADAMRARYSGDGETLSKAYALLGDYFRLAPVPDQVYDVMMIFFKHDEDLTLVNETKWAKYQPDLLIAEAAQIIAQFYLRDDVAAKAMSAWAQERYDAMDRDEKARRSTNFSANPED